MNKHPVINLDPDFTPFGPGEHITIFDFPSGCEPHISVDLNWVPNTTIHITCRIKNGNDIIRILLCVDTLKRQGFNHLQLFIPYLPFARQDRVMNNGEPLSLKVFSDLINSCGFEKVSMFDIHSDVALALINNSESIPNHTFVRFVLTHLVEPILVCPDAGAYKKIFKLCQFLNYTNPLIIAHKIRDVATGHITSMEIATGDVKGKDVCIVDDICDGGSTFILLAKELKKNGCRKVNLIVSHGIFSKSLLHILGHIDHIYVTDSFQNIRSGEDITQYKLQDIL